MTLNGKTDACIRYYHRSVESKKYVKYRPNPDMKSVNCEILGVQ